ncbi:the plant PR-1 class of pathogen related protein-like protein, partial [Suhomyces tanzawaensis NRRL Y-17324]
DSSFAQLILSAHNQYRAQHGVAALTWNQEAYQYAQNNANNYDCSGVLTHTHGKFGENLAAGYSNGPDAVKAWYDEGTSYNYQAANSYDHFTQVVWKGTSSVGCAYKDCRAENWGLYVVCEYDPPGNVVGQNKANVFP